MRFAVCLAWLLFLLPLTANASQIERFVLSSSSKISSVSPTQEAGLYLVQTDLGHYLCQIELSSGALNYEFTKCLPLLNTIQSSEYQLAVKAEMISILSEIFRASNCIISYEILQSWTEDDPVVAVLREKYRMMETKPFLRIGGERGSIFESEAFSIDPSAKSITLIEGCS